MLALDVLAPALTPTPPNNGTPLQGLLVLEVLTPVLTPMHAPPLQ